MADGTNNPPEVLIGLSRADADTLIEHCNSNITFGLLALQDVKSMVGAESIVALLETYKRIKTATQKGLKE